MDARKCKICNGQLPQGKFSLCDKRSCLAEWVDRELEKNHIIYDRLAEI